jgi:hypothetical protein
MNASTKRFNGGILVLHIVRCQLVLLGHQLDQAMPPSGLIDLLGNQFDQGMLAVPLSVSPFR